MSRDWTFEPYEDAFIVVGWDFRRFLFGAQWHLGVDLSFGPFFLSFDRIL